MDKQSKMSIPVLSIRQPWATLVVLGKKRIETRSRITNYRGDILIHASNTMLAANKKLCDTNPFKKALKGIDELPLGAIVGKVTLYATCSTEDIILMKEAKIQLGRNTGAAAWKDEISFGDYSPGRFAWLLKDPVAFTNHFEIKGKLGLWQMDEQICYSCGCTEFNCAGCVEKQGHACVKSKK